VGAGSLSLISNAEVKNKWIYTFTSPYAVMACIGTALPLWLGLSCTRVDEKEFTSPIVPCA
jgi:hypothetical protein